MARRPRVKPLGVGDLIVLKKKISRYDAGEVAHIENILGRESRRREHRRLRQVSETIEVEEERAEENVRDLQSTERFEIESEIERTVRAETAFEAGASLSGGWGPVSISAYARYGSSASTEESRRNANSYAKEITEKSLSRLVEKVREKRVTTTLEEVEEKNLHEVDNRESPEHVVGIYRWVDKFYRVKNVNYGRRLFYEFLVPHPAGVYVSLVLRSQENGRIPTKPPAPTNSNGDPLQPGDLDDTTYLALISEYDVQGVEPPPPETIIVSKEFSAQFEQDRYFDFTFDDVEIPALYRASSCVVEWAGFRSYPLEGFLIIGRHQFKLSDVGQGAAYEFELNSERDKIPVAAVGKGWVLLNIALTLEIECSRTEERLAKWQLDTFSAIMAAYNKQLLAFEEALAASQIQKGITFGGDNPEINRVTEREQLKRFCIGMWTGKWEFRPAMLFGRVSYAPEWAEPIGFLEAAFDWQNMSYEFLPYFYGHPELWLDSFGAKHPDPLFEQFLRAGAARVRLPVQPSHVEAVLWYQLTGEIPAVGSVPALSSASDPDASLYNGYLEELDDAADLPDIDREAEIRPDDPETWLIKVPTSLVWLQQGDNPLPDFEATT